MKRYKSPRQQALFDELLAAARRADSYLFVTWVDRDGRCELYARTGSSHREEFWRGMDGLRSLAERTSDGAVAYAAGCAARRARIEPACSAGRLDPDTGRVRVPPAPTHKE